MNGSQNAIGHVLNAKKQQHANGHHVNGHRANGHGGGRVEVEEEGEEEVMHLSPRGKVPPSSSPPLPHVAAAHDEADEQSSYTYEIVDQVAKFLLKRTDIRPNVGIVCGSGLGSLAEKLENKAIFRYENIPHFPVSSVPGHAGQLVFGYLEDVPVVCMQGRFHYYEGYPLWKNTTSEISESNICNSILQDSSPQNAIDEFTCCMPIRVLKLLGIKILIATNAAGGLNENFKIGDIMIIKDHVNLMGFAGNNPLRGANDERFGPRFPAMSKAYDTELINVAKSIAADMNINDILREGVYTCLGGPCYETPAELKLLKILGIDAVGMSTVHEVVTAVHCGLQCFAFSLITNECVTEYNVEAEANHEEVMDTAKMRAPILQALVAEFIKRVGG